MQHQTYCVRHFTVPLTINTVKRRKNALTKTAHVFKLHVVTSFLITLKSCNNYMCALSTLFHDKFKPLLAVFLKHGFAYLICYYCMRGACQLVFKNTF